MDFFSNLEKECKERNIKINNLGKEIGISSGTFTKWKNGSFPKIDKLRDICIYLDISADKLLDIQKSNKSNLEKKYDMLTKDDKMIVDNILSRYTLEDNKEKLSVLQIG